jgi:putative alpha-1,2-mannosidase
MKATVRNYDKKTKKHRRDITVLCLTDHNIKAEMTAAPHSGMLRFTFPQGKRFAYPN